MERVKSSSLRTYVRTIDQNSIPLLQKLETDRRLIAADFFFLPQKRKKKNLVSRYTRIPFSILSSRY